MAAGFRQVVNKDNTTTTLAVTVNPSVYGQSISFTASVAAVAPGTGTPTGSVTFADQARATLATVTLSGGMATYTTTKLATGEDAITATYNGSSKFATSTVSDPRPSGQPGRQRHGRDALGEPVGLRPVRDVHGDGESGGSPGSGTPTGTVTFYDGTAALDTANLGGGKATFKNLRPGRRVPIDHGGI